MKNLKEIIRQAIDIHVHVGPEIIPRKYMTSNLLKETGKIRGMVLKNHFYLTTPFISELQKKTQLQLYGAVVLNNFIGGLNPEAVYAASLVAERPFFVWFPTIHAAQFLAKSKYEIAPEWVKRKDFCSRKSKNMAGINIIDKKQSSNVISVLKAIQKTDAILATGHISWQESKFLVKKAIQLGLQKMVITHPIYQRINMPITEQIKLASLGCFIEICVSMFSIDGISMEEIVRQIKEVCPKQIILSSDVGQTFSPAPSKALLEFTNLLCKAGVTEDDIFTMAVTNPKRLLGLTPSPTSYKSTS